jgi:hypothetical protein
MMRTALLALLLAAPAGAVTITEVSGPGSGSPMDMDPADFVGSGPCGSGGSVVNDGCSVVLKDADSPRTSGRFDPFGGAWIDSQDRPEIAWTVRRDQPFSSVRFALTDAFDQAPAPRFGGESYFSLSAGDATWSIASREPDGTLHWLEVLLDAPATSVELTFRTRLNDGWGVRQANLAPVPLPATGLLLFVGAAALVGLRRRA